MVATSLADLTDGLLINSINFEEDGLGPLTPSVNGVEVWTGTLSDGTGGGAYCLDWTSGSAVDSGIRAKTNESNFIWTEAGVTSCDALAGKRIYCFER